MWLQNNAYIWAMKKETQIQWADITWNPWQGCTKVSAGCKFCYMMRDKARWKQDGTIITRSAIPTFTMPLREKASKIIFTCSWSDFFHEAADLWREEAWAIIRATPQHTYLILTKRPERVAQCVPNDIMELGNVWIGVSVENNAAMPRLQTLADVPLPHRFISFEPLLEQIDIYQYAQDSPLFAYEWAIIGGESGNERGLYTYRECREAWIRALIIELPADMKIFVKQMGTAIAKANKLKDRHGGVMEEWATDLQIRQHPIKR